MGSPDPDRFARSIAAIDAANAADPNRLVVDGQEVPKELAHAEAVTRWVRRLVPQPGEALLLAARAHHLRRWVLPRNAYPTGRTGYLRWRSEQERRHAAEASALLRETGYGEDLIGRVADLVCKRGLGRDPEVQVLEDALCLVFLETQLADFAPRHAGERILEILQRSLRKMSPQGRRAAAALPLPARSRELLTRAAERLARDTG